MADDALVERLAEALFVADHPEQSWEWSEAPPFICDLYRRQANTVLPLIAAEVADAERRGAAAVVHPLGDNLIHLQGRVAEFITTCVPGSAASYALKAQHEAAELAEACQGGDEEQVAEEAADVLICLMAAGFRRNLAFGAIVRAALAKIEVNLGREWHLKPDGTWQHTAALAAADDSGAGG